MYAERSIYYSSLACNQSTSSAAPPVPCTVSETRSQPLLQRTGDWRLSVVRMSTPPKSLPAYWLQPLVGQSDPDLLDYQVQLKLTMQGAFPVVWPQTYAVGAVVLNVALMQLGAIVATASVDIVAAGVSVTVTSAADIANILEGELQAVSARWATFTVGVDAANRLVFTPPTGYEVQVTSVTGTIGANAEAALGLPQSQWGIPSVKLTALNAAGLATSLFRTLTSTQSAPVYWVPEDQTAPKAAPPLIAADYSTTNYWGYSVTHACQLWNNAYITAYNACVADLETQWRATFPQVWPGVQSVAPVLTFDAATQLFSVSVSPWSSPSQGAAAASLGALYPVPSEALVVAMDESSDALFGNWLSFSPSGSLGTPAYATLNFAAAPIAASGLVKLTQDSSSLAGNWTPVTSLLVTSQNIPVFGEQISAPFLSGNVGGQNSVASSFAAIVAEISLLGQDLFVPTETSVYEPTTLRYVALNGDGPLTSLDFSLQWRDRFGTIRPVYLPPCGAIFTIKCQFVYVGER